MIQPVNASTPRASFRGPQGTYGNRAKRTTTETAFMNAGAVATAAGALTMAVSRAYTNAWMHSVVLGACGAFLSLFFMTPQLIETTKFAKFSRTAEADVFLKDDVSKVAEAVNKGIRPAKRLALAK